MEHQGWNFEENYKLYNSRRSTRPQDELVELLWRDGQVVLQSQTNREQTQAQTEKYDHHQETLRSNTFLEDQETVSWIQYPPDEDPFIAADFSSHFFSTGDPLERPATEIVKHDAGPDPPDKVMPPPKFRLTDPSSGVKELGSSSGDSSGCSFGKNIKEMASVQSITTDRKRKNIMDTDESVSQTDAIGNKSDQRSGSTRRSRAAEVHNLSERRRRDRINERMKALQELIPHCTKTDKASILDEAIDYMKSLKLQLQVTLMGSRMAGTAVAPMMFPGVQPQTFIHQMQSPVQLPRFPVMDPSAIQNNPGLVCGNPVQNQIFSDGFDRCMGVFPYMQAASQPMEMLRFGSQAGQQSQQPSGQTETTDGPR